MRVYRYKIDINSKTISSEKSDTFDLRLPVVINCKDEYAEFEVSSFTTFKVSIPENTIVGEKKDEILSAVNEIINKGFMTKENKRSLVQNILMDAKEAALKVIHQIEGRFSKAIPNLA